MQLKAVATSPLACDASSRVGESTSTKMPSPCRGGALPIMTCVRRTKAVGEGAVSKASCRHHSRRTYSKLRSWASMAYDTTSNDAVAADSCASPDQRLNGGDEEGHRLAGAGLCASHHITSLQHLQGRMGLHASMMPH